MQDEADSNRVSFAAKAIYFKGQVPEDNNHFNIAAVHNFNVGQWGHALKNSRLNNLSITDRMISKFIEQCGYYTWISFTTT